MKQPLVTVIVPVYNVERYISKTINSILSQAYYNLELLLVDDGSTDNSATICERHAQTDSRVRVFHKSNGGVASARNVGLDNAKGEWVCFVDGDDELFPDALENLITAAGGVDLVIAGYRMIDFDGVIKDYCNADETLSKQQCLATLLHNDKYGYQGYCWNKLFNRSVIERNTIRFNENYYFNEDRLFCAKYFSCLSQPARMLDKNVYMYNVCNGDAVASLSKGFNTKFFTDFFAQLDVHELMLKHGVPDVRRLSRKTLYESYWRIKRMLRNRDVIACEPQLATMRTGLVKYVAWPERLILRNPLLKKIYSRIFIRPLW